jgi:hypothetical protein
MSEQTLHATNEAQNGSAATDPKAPGFFKRQATRVWGTTVELAKAPLRNLKNTGLVAATDGKRVVEQAIPTVLIGTPITVGVAALGLAPLVGATALAVRVSQVTDSVIGGVLSACVAFILAAMLFTAVPLVGAIWAAFETLALVAKAAETAEFERAAKLAV